MIYENEEITFGQGKNRLISRDRFEEEVKECLQDYSNSF